MSASLWFLLPPVLTCDVVKFSKNVANWLMIAPLVRRVHWDFEFQLVAFDLRQNVASDNSEPFGIEMMDAFEPLADCVGSRT